jgi:hypothetical protein
MFDEIKDDIFSVFASAGWTGLNIKAFPYNYDGEVGAAPFVKILILPGRGKLDGYSFKKVIDGLLVVQIYVKSGQGDSEYATIADSLNLLFEGKTLTNGTQFGPSNYKVIGRDPSNQALFRVDYAINFSNFGD